MLLENRIVFIHNYDNVLFSSVILKYIPQDVSTRYRSVDMTVLAAFATSFCQRHCVSLCKGTKAAKSAAFCGCLPVFALELGTLCPDLAWGFW